MDKKKLIQYIFEKHGTHINEDDPILLLVDLNMLLLEQHTNHIAKKLEVSAEKLILESNSFIDNYISVSNESLSKLLLRTNELKEILNKIELETSNRNKIIIKSFLNYHLIFITGLLLGIIVTYLIFK